MEEILKVGQYITDNKGVFGIIKEIDYKDCKVYLNLSWKYPISFDDIVELQGFKREIAVYYQPRLTEDEMFENDFSSFDVFRKFENAKAKYPDAIIDVYRGSEIENHHYVDDFTNVLYFVDIPNVNQKGTDEFVNVFESHDKNECILFAQIFMGADVFGNISLISES